MFDGRRHLSVTLAFRPNTAGIRLSGGSPRRGICVYWFHRSIEAQSQPLDARTRRQGGLKTSRATLKLLDGFELVCAGRSVPLPLSAQRLLAFVALHDRPLLRPYVAGSLWLDSSEARAYANLRSALWRLHRCGHQLVESVGQRLRLDPSVVIDLHEAEALAQRILGGTPDTIPAPKFAALESDVLPDWYDDWIVPERERFRQLRLRALDTLCERMTDAGRLDAALELGLAAVAGDPLRESSRRAVMRVHLADGNAAEAIRQYRLFQRLLADQLGLEPSGRMAALLPDQHALATAG
jgi:DNA-binding SARP family transcriptional activator